MGKTCRRGTSFRETGRENAQEGFGSNVGGRFLGRAAWKCRAASAAFLFASVAGQKCGGADAQWFADAFKHVNRGGFLAQFQEADIVARDAGGELEHGGGAESQRAVAGDRRVPSHGVELPVSAGGRWVAARGVKHLKNRRGSRGFFWTFLTGMPMMRRIFGERMLGR